MSPLVGISAGIRGVLSTAWMDKVYVRHDRCRDITVLEFGPDM